MSEIKSNNYQIQAEKAQLEFPKWNHEDIAHKFNLICDQEYLYIDFIGKKYRISRETGTVERSNDGIGYDSQASFNEIMTFLDLFDYSKPDLKLSGEYTDIQSLGAMGHSGKVVGGSLFAPYSKYFSGKCPELAKACLALNGKESTHADVSYIINVFDFLPVMIRFWDQDDEFPAEIMILWDKNILDYMHFETTFYAAYHLLDRIKEIMEEGLNEN